MYLRRTHPLSEVVSQGSIAETHTLYWFARIAHCNNTCLKSYEPHRIVFRSLYTLAITTANLTALPASAMPNKDIPEPTQEEKDYAKNWKGKEKQQRLRALIKKAGLVVNSRGPINAGYAPIMKQIDEVRLMAS